MTSPRDDDRFEVPVARLAGGRGQARRAGLVAFALVTIVGGALLIARLDDRAATPSRSVPASQVATGRSPSPAPSRQRSSVPRVEVLPPIAPVALPGSPETTLVERVGVGGTDLRVFVWSPADGRTETIRVIPGVIDRDEPSPPIPVLSPDRRHVLLLGTSTTATPGIGGARLVDEEGRTLWDGQGVTAVSGALWSADSSLVVVPGQPRRWDLVRIDGGRAADHAVQLPGDIYLPYPLPRTWLTVSGIEPRTVPLGFSADGAWIYGGVISPDLGMLVGQFRVAADGSRVEPLTDFRVGQPDGLIPRPGTSGSQVVDAATGRVATSRINSDTTGGPRTLEVRGPDSAFQYAVGGGVTLGAAWGADGSLVTLSANSLLYPDAIELRRIGSEGSSGPALLSTGPLTTAGLIGVRDGFAIVAFLATRPDTAMELVAVDLGHPEQVTALPLDPDTQLLAATVDR